MKKLGILVMPLMAISFLVSCNHKSTHHFKFIGDHCTLNGKTTYEEDIEVDKVISYTITPDEGYQLDYLDDSIPKNITLEDNVLTINNIDQDYIVNVNAIDNDIAAIILVNVEHKVGATNSSDVKFRSGSQDSIKEVDWGDGVKDTEHEHNYTNNGEYLITIRGELTGFGFEVNKNKRNDFINVVKIYSKITSLFNSAFDNCHNLNSLHFPKCVTSIDSRAFAECSSLTYIDMPYHLDLFGSVDSTIFNGCSKLKSIIVSDGVTTVGPNCFSDCESLTSISLPDTLIAISGNRTFKNCSALPSIVIPNSVTSLASNAFENCASLTSINIPTSPNLSSIPDDFCYGCTALPSIIIPNNITEIGPAAFKKCSNLSVVDLSTIDHVIDIAGDIFEGHSEKDFQIKVKESLKSEYLLNPNWEIYTDYIVGV